LALAWGGMVVAVQMLHPNASELPGGLLASPVWAMRLAVMPWPHWLIFTAIGGPLFLFAMVLFNPWREIRGDYGNAHFATKREAKKLALLDDTGLILGRWGNQYVRTAQPLSVLIFAPPESGKTAAIVIPTLLSCGNSMIVNDVKGELYEKTAGRRREFSRVVKFAPGEEGSTRWNPLSKAELPDRWDDKIISIDRIAGALIQTPAKADPMWTTEARALFKFYALYLVHRDGETSLPGIRSFALSTGDAQEHIAELLDEAGDSLPQIVREEGNGMLAKADKEFAGVFGSFKSAMAVFSDPRVAENCSTSDFALGELRKECTTVYLCVSNADQTRLAPFLAMFFETATLTYIRKEPTPEDYRITYALDEFVRLGKMTEVAKMPAISRSFGVNALFVVQSQSQLKALYDQDGLDELKNTCAYHIVFSQNEQKVAEEISKSIGNYTRKRQSLSDNDKRLSGKSRSENYEGVPLVLPQEIMSMDREEILILRQNAFESPVKCNKAWWFKDKALKPLVGLPVTDDTFVTEDTPKAAETAPEAADERGSAEVEQVAPVVPQAEPETVEAVAEVEDEPASTEMVTENPARSGSTVTNDAVEEEAEAEEDEADAGDTLAELAALGNIESAPDWLNDEEDSEGESSVESTEEEDDEDIFA